MEQLRQRIIASCHLGPMDAAETRAYIEHRLHKVGWTNNPAIDPDAFEVVHRRTGGIPRRVNLLCSRLLLATFLGGEATITGAAVEAIANDILVEVGQSSQDS
jgi:general secretion pathway protein A